MNKFYAKKFKMKMKWSLDHKKHKLTKMIQEAICIIKKTK